MKHKIKIDVKIDPPKMKYFEGGALMAVFNTNDALIVKAREMFIEKYDADTYGKEIQPYVLQGIMSITNDVPNEYTQKFIFDLAVLTDDYFASGRAKIDIAQKRKDADDRANRTGDGLDIRTLTTVYFVNGFADKIQDFHVKKELKLSKDGTIAKKNGDEFTSYQQTISPIEIYGSLSAAQIRLKEHLENSIKHNGEMVDFHLEQKANAEKALEKLAQETAPYLKKETGAKPEKIGKLKI